MKFTALTAAVVAASLVAAPVALAAGHAGAMHGAQPAAATTAHAGQPAQLGPSQTGQPNQSCGSATAPETPGHAASAPGSAFNPSGTAGGVYAGQQTQNSRNSASVSQYDVACAHQR